MAVINVDSTLLIFIVLILTIFCLGVVIYCVHRDRKRDKEEIEELINEKDEVKKEVKEVDFVEKKSEIEELLEKMQQDLEAKTQDVVEKFEQEQEEKSIISYQELVNSLKNSTVQKVSIPDKKDVIKEVAKEPIIEEKKETKLDVLEKELEAKKEDKKFKSTDFISPIYGKMEDQLEYPTIQSFEKKEQVKFDFENELDNSYELELETKNIDDYLDEFDFSNNMEVNSLEQTLNMSPISAEVKKNDEFLQALKEFRKNLE